MQLCDELGFDYSFCVEHHFRPDESWMSSPSLYAVGAGARTKRHARRRRWATSCRCYHPLRLAEEIAIVDQMLGGRMELRPGARHQPGLFHAVRHRLQFPQIADAGIRRLPARRLSATSSRSRSTATTTTPTARELAVQPVQKPHPPLWMMSRDPQTLEFCAKNGINPGYFLVYPRADAAPRYRKFLADWSKAGWPRKPNIAYCTVVYVDETDEKALDVALVPREPRL